MESMAVPPTAASCKLLMANATRNRNVELALHSWDLLLSAMLIPDVDIINGYLDALNRLVSVCGMSARRVGSCMLVFCI